MGLLGLEAEIEPYNVDNEDFWTDRHDAGKLIIWDRKKNTMSNQSFETFCKPFVQKDTELAIHIFRKFKPRSREEIILRRREDIQIVIAVKTTEL